MSPRLPKTRAEPKPPPHTHRFMDVLDRSTWPAGAPYSPPAGVIAFVEALVNPAAGWRGTAVLCADCGRLMVTMDPKIVLTDPVGPLVDRRGRPRERIGY